MSYLKKIHNMLACNIYKVTINNTITSFILFENYSIIRYFFKYYFNNLI